MRSFLYDVTIRDNQDYNVVFQIKKCPEHIAHRKLAEFVNQKLGVRKRCPLNLHNWPDMRLDTKCLDCGLTVRRFRKEKKLRKEGRLSWI